MDTMDCRLKLLVFHPDSTFAHVAIINPQVCHNCEQGICLSICPSEVFQRTYPTEEPAITVRYEQCIECGVCRLVCPHSNIEFHYPNGGYGVCFNDGVSLYPVPANSLTCK